MPVASHTDPDHVVWHDNAPGNKFRCFMRTVDDPAYAGWIEIQAIVEGATNYHLLGTLKITSQGRLSLELAPSKPSNLFVVDGDGKITQES